MGYFEDLEFDDHDHGFNISRMWWTEDGFIAELTNGRIYHKQESQSNLVLKLDPGRIFGNDWTGLRRIWATRNCFLLQRKDKKTNKSTWYDIPPADTCVPTTRSHKRQFIHDRNNFWNELKGHEPPYGRKWKEIWATEHAFFAELKSGGLVSLGRKYEDYGGGMEVVSATQNALFAKNLSNLYCVERNPHNVPRASHLPDLQSAHGMSDG